ncbi:MAG: type III-A CRISPR-associated RAMP protein Csm5 [Armatimonadetes bacterium]|nr:type III-A CRISPR-associated RAMP protein Csm5 [Armatimonadota bacterium]
MIKTLTCARTFTVTFLSPVHIGTEERLDEHDFVYENGQLIRFRVTPILEQMDDEQLSQFVENGLEAVMDWLRQTELWQRAKVYQSPVTRQPNWRSEPIRPFIADPLLRPYLPGTEIKGAIRTAVAWWLLRQKNLAALRQKLLQRLPQHQPSRRELVQAGQWLEQSLFGSDPNHDILRSLRVQDSTPVEPERLKVFPVIVAVRTNKGLQWLQSPRGGERRSRYTDDHRQAVANFCECLDGSVSGVKLTVASDTFLSDGEIERGEVKLSVPEELGWEETKRQAVANWETACNELAKEVAESERNWWKEVKDATHDIGAKTVAARMEQFYDELSNRIKAESDEAVFLNIGWGGGWRTKTVVELFGDEAVQEVVSRYRLDRGSHSRPFPKTRKVAWRGSNDFVPLGWLKLSPVVR